MQSSAIKWNQVQKLATLAVPVVLTGFAVCFCIQHLQRWKGKRQRCLPTGTRRHVGGACQIELTSPSTKMWKVLKSGLEDVGSNKPFSCLQPARWFSSLIKGMSQVMSWCHGFEQFLNAHVKYSSANMSSLKVIDTLGDHAAILTGHSVGAISLQLHEGKGQRQRCGTPGARWHAWGTCPLRLHRFNFPRTRFSPETVISHRGVESFCRA